MYTDLVGYTALGQRDESLSLALVDAQQNLLRPVIARHEGREVKTMGDAFLVEFTSAVEAVRCAYDIQRSVREFNLSLPSEKRIHMRVGIHLGEVVEKERDIFGDAVNVASRIEPLAEDGGVCLTQQVYDQVHSKLDFQLIGMDKQNLKNVSEPTEVYRMVMPWNEEKAVSPPQLDRNRIAVLPFANMSPDPKDEYFADGMTEELISTTSSIAGLTLIARTSVMGYKGTAKKVEEIGKELSVGTILEGSVRKAGNRLRIAVQLIDVKSQGHLWVQSYDRDINDVFSVQSDISKRVAESLKVQMLPDEVRLLERKPTQNTDAYTFYIRAMQLSHEGTEHSLREAVDLFNRAVSEDPEFARAYAGLSQAWGRLAAAAGYVDFGVGVNNSEVAATKALELDPSLAEAHAAMAQVNFYLDRLDKSIAQAEKAIEINPNQADAHSCLGIDYAAWGPLDHALVALRKAFELDPLSVFAGLWLAEVCEVAGKERDGLAVLERMNELHPNTPVIYAGLAEHYIWKRDYVRTQEMLDKALAINPREPFAQIYRGVAYALVGRRKEAQESLAEIQRDKNEATRLWGEVFIQAALGNLDEAFKALMRQTQTHSWYYLMKYLPVFEELRKDPRFLEFCTKVGIPPPNAE